MLWRHSERFNFSRRSKNLAGSDRRMKTISSLTDATSCELPGQGGRTSVELFPLSALAISALLEVDG
jgi:hypothetical protein